MKLVAYIRVSTLGQVKDGLGLPTQERLVRSWAKANNHRLVALLSENGRSGTLPDAERPGLFEALSAIRRGDAEGVVVTSLDRLARLLTVQEAILAKVWSMGGKVFSVDGGEVQQDDPDDPMRTAMRQMAGVFAQLERGMVVKRLRNGRQTKADRGGYACGSPAYGFKAVGGALVANPDEMAGLERIRQLRGEDRSFQDIAAVLTEEGYQPKRAKRWHAECVRRIVDRL